MMMQKLLFSSYTVALLAIFSWVILVYSFCLTRSHEGMPLQMRRRREISFFLLLHKPHLQCSRKGQIMGQSRIDLLLIVGYFLLGGMAASISA